MTFLRKMYVTLFFSVFAIFGIHQDVNAPTRPVKNEETQPTVAKKFRAPFLPKK